MDPEVNMSDTCTPFINYTNQSTSKVAEDNNNMFDTGLLAILFITCLVAMCINIVVIASVFWITTPMTPNLKISLSLAAADACSSILYGLPLFLDGYVEGYVDFGMFINLIELFRMSCTVITAVHLMALGMNHYIGIMKPLHYNSIVTSKKVAVVIVLLWVCPTLIVLTLWLGFDKKSEFLYSLANNGALNLEFLNTFAFRISFSSLFFIPTLLMVLCYTHILVVVRRQQKRWNNLARSGSTRFRGRKINTSSNNSSENGSGHLNREQKQLIGTVRAIHTTLLILGSCLLGWTPALVFFTICCPIGCYIQGKDLQELNCKYRTTIAVLRSIENMLVILKMLANPIIYSIRMKSIKEGTHRMCLAITSLFCRSRRDLDAYRAVYQKTKVQNSLGTGSMQVRMTSLKTNGTSHVGCGKEFSNTFL